MTIQRNYHLPFPDSQQHWLQACTMHACKVINVKDTTGTGMVQVQCTGLWGTEVSIWIPTAGNNVGSDKPERKQTGSWQPAQPGQHGYVFFPGGNYKKPTFMAAGPWMSGKGEAG